MAVPVVDASKDSGGVNQSSTVLGRDFFVSMVGGLVSAVTECPEAAL
jgi:hypothetical protein